MLKRKKNLLQRVNSLANKIDTTDITKTNIMELMYNFKGLSFNDIMEMPIYTYNCFIEFLHGKSETKTLGGQVINMGGGINGLGLRKKT